MTATILPFTNPCGRTMPVEDPEMIKAKAFASFYASERSRGVDPDTAYQRAGQHILEEWHRLMGLVGEAMKEA